MSNQGRINSEHHLPLPISTSVNGAAYASATALAVSTVAMAVLLTIYPHIGIVGFSIMAGAEGLSFVLFVVSFCLLNKQQDEQLKQFRFKVPAAIVVRAEDIPTQTQPTPPPSQPQPHPSPSNSAEELVTVHPLSADWNPEQQPPDQNSGENVGEKDIPTQTQPTPPPSQPQPNLSPSNSAEEPITVRPLSAEWNPEQQPPDQNSDKDEGIHREDTPPPLLQNEEDFGFIDVGETQQLTIAQTREPMPVDSLEYINEFRKSLPGLFKAAEDFFASFVSAYSRSQGNTPSSKTLTTIHESFQELFQVINDILQDNIQLFRLALGALITSFVDKKHLQPYLASKNDPMEFVRTLPSFLTEAAYQQEAALNSTRQLLEMIATNAHITVRSDQLTLQSLYQTLQKASAQLTEATGMVEEEVNNTDKNQKAIKTQSEKKEEYNAALMGILDWLFFKCEYDESLVNAMVLQHVAPIFEKIRNKIPEIISKIFQNIRVAYEPESMMNNTSTKTVVYAATSFNGKLIRSQMNKAIGNVPLAERYSKTLTDGFVETFIPTLMDPIFYATVGDKSLWSSDPHPFRVALKQMIDLGEFTTLQEVPESQDWPDCTATLSRMLQRFTEQLKELRF